jgi:hypothetical protein
MMGMSYTTSPERVDLAALLPALAILSAPTVAAVLRTFAEFKDGGDIVTQMKAAQVRADEQRKDTLDLCIYLVRIAYPNDYRMKRVQVRQLVRLFEQHGAKAPGEPT